MEIVCVVKGTTDIFQYTGQAYAHTRTLEVQLVIFYAST